ncbi:hypothetical protein GOV11_02620 [Candidatus Woesearchaeota archaeon]|nr:hypothetical protein [Candidatus Woesearchaeota archaeon]
MEFVYVPVVSSEIASKSLFQMIKDPMSLFKESSEMMELLGEIHLPIICEQMSGNSEIDYATVQSVLNERPDIGPELKLVHQLGLSAGIYFYYHSLVDQWQKDLETGNTTLSLPLFTESRRSNFISGNDLSFRQEMRALEKRNPDIIMKAETLSTYYGAPSILNGMLLVYGLLSAKSDEELPQEIIM